MYTMQEAFEKMCKHIFEQGKPSTNGLYGEYRYCLYRGVNGLKCVVGGAYPRRRVPTGIWCESAWTISRKAKYSC